MDSIIYKSIEFSQDLFYPQIYGLLFQALKHHYHFLKNFFYI